MSDSRAGLVNPYALAELAVGRRVRWTSVTDHEAFVEKVLGASIEQLCAPVAGNPLVSGAADAQEALFSIREATTERGAAFRSHAEGGLTGAMLSRLSPPAQMRIISALAGGEKEAELEYTPAGAEWADAGDYFEEAAEFFDPVQGALGDCYFIAALSAVAWSRPYVIVLRERAIGHGQQDFVDRIDFYPAGSLTSIEVSERLPLVKSTHAWIYARSSEAGEVWPAVYEKAYAKWKTNDPSDEPNYGPIAGGDPVAATTELTNLAGVTKTCSDLTADEIWSGVGIQLPLVPHD